MAEGDLNDLGSLKELRELVEFLKASGVSQFDMERPEMKIRLKFSGPESVSTPGISGVDLATLARMVGSGGGNIPSAAIPAPVEGEHASFPGTASATQESAAVDVDENAGLHIVKSPLVGTFYDAPSPGADTFVKVGETVALGKVLCIVEAMKIMNEIECDAAGEVAKVFVKPGQPVEYGQPLFGVRA